MAFAGMLTKPSKLERLERQEAKRIKKRRAKRTQQRAEADSDAQIRRALYQRDGGVCRACRLPLKLQSSVGYWWEIAHAHHIVYRSAGGDDSLSNRLLLCPKCHFNEHSHLLRIVGTDGGELVTFRKVNLETGKARREWEG